VRRGGATCLALKRSKGSYSCHVGRNSHGFAVVAATIVATIVASGPTAAAQTVEISPFYGYRVGGSISEVTAGPVVDDDGGPSFGVIVNVVFGLPTDGLKVEGIYSHEEARLTVRSSQFDPPRHASAQVDQVLVGGIRDLTDGRARPFLSGLFGITRYAVPGDTEVRFAIGVGTGMKAYFTSRLGLRLDARGYMTIINLGSAGVCGGFGCAIAFNVSPAFQGDLTAGLIVAF
jgi:hypothetical protein